MVYFFFQAEDGIRAHCVTGVQTCALPILKDARYLVRIAHAGVFQPSDQEDLLSKARALVGPLGGKAINLRVSQIGRASCRERGWISVGAGGVSKKETSRSLRDTSRSGGGM